MLPPHRGLTEHYLNQPVSLSSLLSQDYLRGHFLNPGLFLFLDDTVIVHFNYVNPLLLSFSQILYASYMP